MASSPHPTSRTSSARRRRLVALPSVLLAAGLAVTALAAPATADPTPTASPSTTAAPTLASVTVQLADLAKANEALAEKFNAATIDLTAKQQAAAAAQATAAKAQTDWQDALKRYGSTIVEQYQNGSLSRAGALLTSTSTQQYLDTMSDLATVSQHNSAVVDELTVTKQHATVAQAAAGKAVTDATAVRDSLAQQKKDIEARQKTYTALLTSLTPVQQATYKASDDVPGTSGGGSAAGGNSAPAAMVIHAGSAAAQTAIDFALAQRGKPYRYAAAGPSAYDCSGLTMAAYAAAGVSLPHQSSEQYNYGTHVPLSEMQPGDLVFFYSPISHVAIYLGNGMIVHAPTSGDVVKVSPMFSGAVGATRLT